MSSSYPDIALSSSFDSFSLGGLLLMFSSYSDIVSSSSSLLLLIMVLIGSYVITFLSFHCFLSFGCFLLHFFCFGGFFFFFIGSLI
jgi:hypothetical protein